VKPKWVNRNGYREIALPPVYGWFWTVKVMKQIQFLNSQNPPYLVDRDGRHWTWRDNLRSDGNSTPAWLRCVFPEEYGVPSCYLHDQAYKTGWVYSRLDGGAWEPLRICREKSDDLIAQGWQAADVTERRCHIAHRLLRMVGWASWKGKR
jgi:hypothetical protein